MKQQQAPYVDLKPGIVWMHEDHHLIASISAEEVDGVPDVKVRDRLRRAVEDRFTEGNTTFAKFMTAATLGVLSYFEDDEHGLQYGVVLQ